MPFFPRVSSSAERSGAYREPPLRQAQCDTQDNNLRQFECPMKSGCIENLSFNSKSHLYPIIFP